MLDRLMQLHPKVIDLTLDRIERLLDLLGNPERALPPVVHVAGTNGKGSTIAFMRAALECAGLRVHVYTSPHLVRFRERIRLAGTLITEQALIDLLEQVEAVNGTAPITFFEITTAAAFKAFADTPGDVVLLETGLGGRLDATNLVAKPALSVITPIAMDHQQYLGDTLAKIAFEKAGILKPAVPAVIAQQQPDAAAVIAARAAEIGAPLVQMGTDVGVNRVADGFRLIEGGIETWLPTPSLQGDHQISNAALAATALAHLPARLSPKGTAVSLGLRTATWPARAQRMDRHPLLAGLPDGSSVWIDGGHNPHAATALAAVFQDRAKQDAEKRPLVMICGMLNVRDPAAFLTPLLGVVDHVIGIAIEGEQNTLSAEAMAAAAKECGFASHAAPSVEGAFADITAGTDSSVRVLIAGSLYLAGHVLAMAGDDALE